MTFTVNIQLNIKWKTMYVQMQVAPQLDSARTVHFVRNIVGRVTYGLVGLDKLLQDKPDEADDYLRTFLSLFQSSGEHARPSHRLLPQVEDTLGHYSPKLTQGLQDAASRIEVIRKNRGESQEIEEAYSQLAQVLDMIYEATETRPQASVFKHSM